MMSTNAQQDFTPLHNLDLGAPMTQGEIEQVLRNARGQDVVRAVLQHLRNESAVLCFTGRQPPPQYVAPGDYRAYHDGGADALEQACKTLYAAERSGVDEDGE